jgi:hypothetical protein
MHQRLLGLGRELFAELAVGDCPLVVDVCGEKRIIVIN